MSVVLWLLCSVSGSTKRQVNIEKVGLFRRDPEQDCGVCLDWNSSAVKPRPNVPHHSQTSLPRNQCTSDRGLDICRRNSVKFCVTGFWARCAMRKPDLEKKIWIHPVFLHPEICWIKFCSFHIQRICTCVRVNDLEFTTHWLGSRSHSVHGASTRLIWLCRFWPEIN